jgi:hypothetical protein
MTNTYIALSTITLATATSSVTFGSIPQTYRDLVLVVGNLSAAAANTLYARLNGDSGSNYSLVVASGSSGGVNFNSSGSTDQGMFFGSGFQGVSPSGVSQATLQIMDYSATDKHKSSLSRYSATVRSEVDMGAARWANTSAVTSIEARISGSVSYNSGTTFSLYGIRS